MLLVLVATLLCCAGAQEEPPDYGWDTPTALDDYVWEDDGFYSWELLDTYRYDNATLQVTCYVVNMTSQKWQDYDFVDRPVWWHIMMIAVPDQLDFTEHAWMIISSGSNDPEYPGRDSIAAVAPAMIAQSINAIGATLQQVPNQPLHFHNDPNYQRRSEDSIIAWSWRTAANDTSDHGRAEDLTVPLRQPMTRAAKRGLDTITAVVEQQTGHVVDKFHVTGASKRGWTTWSLAAVDRRVVSLVPVVFSLLNMEPTLDAHWRAMDGGWSWALAPYYDEDLTKMLLDPRADMLWEVEDMYRYRSRLARPKLLVSGAADQFFLTHDLHTWWDGMSEPKWHLMCRNADHILTTCWRRAANDILGFIRLQMEGGDMPEVTWERHVTEDGGHIVMHPDPLPMTFTGDDIRCDGDPPNNTQEQQEERFAVRGWRSVTLEDDSKRDWRLMAINETSGEIVPHRVWWDCRGEDVVFDEEESSFHYHLETVDDRWVGFIIEADWEGPLNFTLTLSTEAHIIPDTFPRDSCQSPDECYGSLK